MKKTTFLLCITILLFNSVNAQLLYSENFNSYTVGNVATGPLIPGQGGWFASPYSGGKENNSLCRIQWESGKDLYLLLDSELSAPTPVGQNAIVFKNIGNFWKLRNVNNNVLQFEFEFNTNLPLPLNSNASSELGFIASLANESTFSLYYYLMVFHDYKLRTPYPSYYPVSPSIVKPNVWQKVILYFDYNNYEAYIHFPSENYAAKIYNINPTDNALELNYIQFLIKAEDNPTHKTFFKVDNIKISAVNKVPTLSVNDVLSESFNLYPNPATNIVNITKSDNMFVNQVQVYDLSGKLVNTQKFTNKTEIQLNVETLKSGTYLLHLQTNEGVAVKKLIKK